jgi:hypothetical protein
MTTSAISQHGLGAASAPARRQSAPEGIPTWMILVGMLALSSLTTLAMQELVFTRDIYHRFYDQQLDPSRVDAMFDLSASWRGFGYLFATIGTLLRIVTVTFTFQSLLLLLGGVEVRLGELLRVASLAYGALLGGMVMRTGWFYLMRDSLDAQSLMITPDSLAGVIYAPGEGNPIVYSALTTISVSEIGWIVAASALLMGLGKRVSRTQAIATVAATWTVVAVLRVALAALTVALGR